MTKASPRPYEYAQTSFTGPPSSPADRAGAGLPRFCGTRCYAACGLSFRRSRRSRVTAERVTGGNLGQGDPEAVGVLDLHLDQVPGLRQWFPRNRDSGRGEPGVLGVNIADLDPDQHRGPGRAACPDTSSTPGRGRTPARDHPAGRTPGKSPGPAGHGRSGGCGPGRSGAAGSGCSEPPCHHSNITLSDPGGLTRTRAVPPFCTSASRSGLGAWSLQIRFFCRVGLPVYEIRGWTSRTADRPRRAAARGC
jgi:hypothetical protein